GGDYLSFTAAVTDLTTLGIAGPVVFEVADGTYTEQISIPAITGSSAINTIAFRGQSLDSTTVTLTSSGGGNYLIDLNGASYITFEHLGLQRTGSATLSNIVIINGSSHVTIRNNRMETVNSTLTTIGVRCHVYSDNATTESAVSILNNRMINGLFGLFWDGNGQADDIQFNGNIIEDGSIHVTAVDGGLEIVGNDVTQSLSAEEVIHVASCNVAMLIGENHFLHSNGGTPPNTGYFNGNNGALGAEGVIRNNMFLTTGVYAGAVAIYSSAHLHYLHNSSNRRVVIVSNTNTEVRANLFYNLNGSYRTFSGDNGITLCDHNVYWSNTATKEVSWNGVTYNSLAGLQAANGMDANSLWEDPLPVDPNVDLHILSTSPCIGAAPDPPLVTVDIDQDTRPSPVASVADIGADESPVACSPMSGTYIIGPSLGADYPDFSTSVAQLISCGIGGAVVFQVEPGTYTEAITFPPVSGTSFINTITYEGIVGDSTQVILNYPATATNSPIDHVLRFDGVDHVTFRHMTIERYGPDTYGDVIHMNPGISGSNDPSQHVTVESCRILRTGGSGTARNLVNAANFPALNEIDIRFEGNFMSGGYYAFGNPGNHGDEWIITGNTIQNCAGGILIFQASSVTITDNRIESTIALGQPGIRVNCACPAVVTGNQVIGRGRAVELTIDPPPGQRALLANNSLIVSSGAANGVQFIGLNEDIDLVFNSVSVVSGRGVHQLTGTGSSGLTLQGNAIRSSTGRAIDLPWAGAFTTLDHQALYTGGSVLATWNTTNCADLSALQATSGFFTNSLEADPNFVDPLSDLHLQSGSACLGSAVPLLGIIDDMDGEVRPQPAATQPDIGADEHPDACSPLAGTYRIGASVAAHYPSFTGAVNAMLTCGIDGPVVFEVEDGTYTEQITLPTITGNSNVNTITFRGQSLDSS
ncbi:MAG: hypothetical protein KDB96_14020, partial [Flavobacteriales bacterium]|nr:hypothetical protein [Flavobacteriales bacterium]